MWFVKGSFQWGGGGFSDSAGEISFSLEGDEAVPVLRAFLSNVDGELVPADVNLAERIHNNNGEFYFGKFASFRFDVDLQRLTQSLVN